MKEYTFGIGIDLGDACTGVGYSKFQRNSYFAFHTLIEFKMLKSSLNETRQVRGYNNFRLAVPSNLNLPKDSKHNPNITIQRNYLRAI